MEDIIQKYLIPIILAVCGGIADFIQSDQHTILKMITAMFLAAFTGYLALLLCMEYNVSERLTGVSCGLAGYSSRAILPLFRKLFLDKIKIYTKKE